MARGVGDGVRGGPAEEGRDLSTGPLPGHFLALGVPAAVGTVFNTLYNVVDVWFAGLVGTAAQAGLSVSFSVFFVMVALGFGLGAGLNALIGNALGRRDRAEAARHAAQGLVLTAMLAGLIVIAGPMLAPAVLRGIGTEGPRLVAAIDYLSVLWIAAPSFLMAFAANGVCAAQGDTRSFQRALIAAFFANLALNPLFVLVFDLGLAGVAWATAVAQTGVAAWMLRRAVRSPVMRACGAADFRPDPAAIADVARQGLPASFNMMMIVLGGLVIQTFLQRFGAPAVAGYGVALRIEQMVLLPGFGITAALLPIVAQNNGAGDRARVLAALRLAMLAGCGLMLLGSVLITLFGAMAMRIFTDDPEVVADGALYLSYARWMLPVYFALFALTSFLQGIKRPIWPVAIGVFRNVAFVAAFGWLFVGVLDRGLEGVFEAILCAVFSGLVLAVTVAWAVGRRALPAAAAPA